MSYKVTGADNVMAMTIGMLEVSPNRHIHRYDPDVGPWMWNMKCRWATLPQDFKDKLLAKRCFQDMAPHHRASHYLDVEWDRMYGLCQEYNKSNPLASHLPRTMMHRGSPIGKWFERNKQVCTPAQRSRLRLLSFYGADPVQTDADIFASLRSAAQRRTQQWQEFEKQQRERQQREEARHSTKRSRRSRKTRESNSEDQEQETAGASPPRTHRSERPRSPPVSEAESQSLQVRTFLEALGLAGTFTIFDFPDVHTVEKAFRLRARKVHPDVNPGPHADAQMKLLVRARDALCNEPERSLCIMHYRNR